MLPTIIPMYSYKIRMSIYYLTHHHNLYYNYDMHFKVIIKINFIRFLDNFVNMVGSGQNYFNYNFKHQKYFSEPIISCYFIYLFRVIIIIIIIIEIISPKF
jgi:hypothetical protein